MNPPSICPTCQNVLPPGALFCPKCGTKVTNAPFSISLGKELGVYALSVFLPPLGLWPAIKYLKLSDKKAKRVGIISIVLTILSVVISIWFSLSFISQFTTTFQQYQNLGL